MNPVRRSPAWLRSLLSFALVTAPMSALAQVNRSEFSLDTQLTATDNVDLAAPGAERDDVLLRLTPRLKFGRDGGRLKLDADVGAAFVGSTRGTRSDRVLPDALAKAELIVVERLMFLEANADLRQVEENPFGPRAAGDLDQDTRLAGTLRFSPYLRAALSSTTSAEARWEGIWTRYKDTVVGDSRTRRALGKVESQPLPVGWLLELSQETTDSPNPLFSEVEIAQATATVTLAIASDWVVGVAGGRERILLDGQRESDTLAGGRLYWVPGPRTEFALAADRRFFGTGWNLSARHRTPASSIQLRFLREPATAGSGLRGDGLAAFLDAILTTRNPDVAARSLEVNQIVATREFSAGLPSAISITAPYPQLRTAAEVAWVHLSPRTAITVAAFGEERVRLERQGVPSGGATDSDVRQASVSLGWNRRLSRQLGVDIAAALSRVAGLGSREGDLSREASVRLSFISNLSPRLNATYGLGARRARTNVTGLNPFDETSAFAGFTYRF